DPGTDRERGRNGRELDHGRRVGEHHRRLVPGPHGFDRLQTGQVGGASVIDHVSLGVADLERAAQFYEAVLGTLGFAKLEVRPATVGFGKRYAEFWLNHRPGVAQV